MMLIKNFIENFNAFIKADKLLPWELINDLEKILLNQIAKLDHNYTIENNIAIHKNAIVEQGAILKGTIIISENCFIAANAYLRGPLFLGKSVLVGPGCEISKSVIFENSAIAHFNYIGHSIIGRNVNFEAGAVCANHHNERVDKNISVFFDGKVISTNCSKFGSLVGDDCKIGANAVLSPGTILTKGSIIKRLELVEQLP
jgi:UDP-N-acetylglucosamine diphosphorylase / glucose-1-phosphate thymidylyltransferase / UDP-N-acetylgalactosamine diphosphorylase / glucosamine-1-phosphate N-acetyltransferase / galactosamine-1-phosphate N-acetyltransferase